MRPWSDSNRQRRPAVARVRSWGWRHCVQLPVTRRTAHPRQVCGVRWATTIALFSACAVFLAEGDDARRITGEAAFFVVIMELIATRVRWDAGLLGLFFGKPRARLRDEIAAMGRDLATLSSRTLSST